MPLRASPRPFNGATEEDVPNGLAGWTDFRKLQLEGAANELAAGIKRKIDARSV